MRYFLARTIKVLTTNARLATMFITTAAARGYRSDREIKKYAARMTSVDDAVTIVVIRSMRHVGSDQYRASRIPAPLTTSLFSASRST
jgi:hypothetical protein